jgi:WXG100 family type VII secretion target
MSDLKVNFGGLSTAAADIQASASNIESRLNDLDASLQPLRANWSGEASTAYTAAKAKWETALSDMKALLADVGRAVSTSGEEYQSTERNNAARW